MRDGVIRIPSNYEINKPTQKQLLWKANKFNLVLNLLQYNTSLHSVSLYVYTFAISWSWCSYQHIDGLEQHCSNFIANAVS